MIRERRWTKRRDGTRLSLLKWKNCQLMTSSWDEDGCHWRERTLVLWCWSTGWHCLRTIMRSWVRSQPPLSSFLWNLPSDFVRCQRTLRKSDTRVTKMSFGKPAWGVKWFNWSSMAKWNPYQLLKECSPILEPRKLLPNIFFQLLTRIQM